MQDLHVTIIEVLSMGFKRIGSENIMKIKEHLTIIEQKDIINDISSDTGIEPKTIQDMLYSLRNTMEYYGKSVTIGESKDEKFLIKLFPSFYIFIHKTKPYERKLKGKTIKVPSRIRAIPKFTRYFQRKIINGLKDGWIKRSE